MFQKLEAVNFRRKNTPMNDLQVFKSITEFQNFRAKIHPEVEIGFVPTMGALHAGHASLLKKSCDENDLTVLSIFVNPTQFNNSNDFTNYPITWEHDLIVAKNAGANFIIAPDQKQIYPDNYRFQLTENEFSKVLCGAHRKGHFDGVLTVVMKLLILTQPKRAYFGEKDYQQLQLVKDMVNSFFVNTEIISVPTFREASGLAMSSRNLRLSADGQKQASLIYKFLKSGGSASEIKEQLTTAGFEVDYVEDFHHRRFVAATLEGVRLIDNVEIK